MVFNRYGISDAEIPVSRGHVSCNLHGLWPCLDDRSNSGNVTDGWTIFSTDRPTFNNDNVYSLFVVKAKIDLN